MDRDETEVSPWRGSAFPENRGRLGVWRFATGWGFGLEGSDLREWGVGFGPRGAGWGLDLHVAESDPKFACGGGDGRNEGPKEPLGESGATFESDSENVRLDIALGGYTLRIAGPGGHFVPRILDFSDSSRCSADSDGFGASLPRMALCCGLHGASVVGGWAGYGIGHFLYDSVGAPVIAFYHLQTQFETFRNIFNTYGAWIVLIKGMTPVPYKLITITAGATGMNWVTFSIASVVSRGMRFVIEAELLRRFGPSIRPKIDRYLEAILVVLLVLLLGGFFLLKLLP